jgi:hypothetical protein
MSERPVMKESGFAQAVRQAVSQRKKAEGTFLKLANDGDTAELVLVGKVITFEGAWDGSRFAPWRDEFAKRGLSPRQRYAINGVRLTDKRAVVVEVNEPTVKEWVEDLEGVTSEKLVRLKRVGGRGDPKSRTTARVTRELTAAESDAVDEVLLHDLEAIYEKFKPEVLTAIGGGK